MSREDDEAFELLCSVPMKFGLRAQGHLDTVARMVRENKSWDEIGQAIGWAPDAVAQHWEFEINRRRHGDD